MKAILLIKINEVQNSTEVSVDKGTEVEIVGFVNSGSSGLHNKAICIKPDNTFFSVSVNSLRRIM